MIAIFHSYKLTEAGWGIERNVSEHHLGSMTLKLFENE